MERLGQTKVTYTHSRDALRNPLNIDLNINNERQDYKIGTVRMSVGGYLWEGGG
jgi:hypothetical protein